MKHTILDVLPIIKPGAIWSLRGYEYSGLEWKDSNQTKPTEMHI